MTKRTLKASTAALLSTSAFFALATPSYAQSLDVPSGSTYTLAADEGADTLTGAGTVDLDQYILTVGADGSSSTFDGALVSTGGLQYVGSWSVYGGVSWSTGMAPVYSATEAAAYLFGGNAADYRVSTAGDQVSAIDDQAWYDVYAVGRSLFSSTYRSDANGSGFYDQPGDSSAYVIDNSVTDLNYAFSYGGTGPGGLTKVGSGTLTLNGTGDWGGQTQVLGGTLQGTTNSISGSAIVVDSASLFYDQAFDGTVAQDISGSGVVTAYAPGQTLTFSGDLTNGRLQVGPDTTVELQGTNNFTDTAGVWVANNGVLRVTDGASISASEIGVLGSSVFMTLDNQGSITGTAYYGVNPYSGMISNGAATNTDALISGGHTGIIGGGSLTVDNFGQVQGGTNDGINAWGGPLTLTNHGDAVIYGAGTSGGSSGYGVVATGDLSGSNDGSILGRFAGMTSRGDLDFTNNGLIGSGAFDASNNFVYSNGNDGVQVLGGGTLTNSATGQILGSISGVYTQGAAASIDNAGIINGQNNGVYADSDLAVTNRAGATISGSNHGIQFNRATNTLDNSGIVIGGVLLAQANAALDADNAAGGLIASTNGVALQTISGTSLTLDNAGDIVGTSGGVDAQGTTNSITNSGRIASGTLSGGIITTNGNTALITRGGTLDNLAGGEIRGGWGVAAYGGASVTNAGTIAGTDEGLYLGLGGSVTNSGSISGGNAAWYQRGVLVQNAAGTVTNLAGGTISGGRGVDFEGVGGTVDNAGTITGWIDAVQISGTGTVTNQATGAINGHDFGVRIFGAGSTVTNAGTISASSAQSNYTGVRMDGANASVSNNVGTISGGNGVLFAGSGTLTNSGQVHGTNANGDGVQGNGALTATNAAGAVIDAGRIGISSFGAGLTLTNDGSVGGNQYGAVYTSGGTNTVTNNATGILRGTGTANGLNLRGTTSVGNAGLIEGSSTAWSNGIYGSGGALTVVNSGTIRSHLDGNGIDMYGGTLNLTNSATGVIGQNPGEGTWGVLFEAGATGSVTNAGLIDGETGIYVDTGSANVVLANSGTVRGSNNGITMLGAGTVTNAAGGAIVGGTGAAIVANTAGSVTLDLQAGSVVTGSVLSANSGARGVTVNGALNGAYDASTGTGVDTVSLGAAGTLASASLGGGDDVFTTLGGAITGNVDGGAETDSLTFDVAGNVTYGGNFTAFETGTKTGTGRVSLTGVNAVNTMFVNGGILAVNGILGSAVTVNSGGTLGGNGTINGSLVIASGAHLAPGNSIGTLHVTGPVTFAAGSTYDVEIDPTASDQLIATGAVTINGGTVNVIGTGTAYAPLTTYAIVEGSSVTGMFDSVVDNLAFLDPTLTYTATSVNLEMRRNDIDFADVAGNPNQAGVAMGVQSLASGTLYDAILVQDATNARIAYDTLSGDIHPTTVAVLAQQGDRLRVVQLDQSAAAGDGFGLWADASAGVGSLEASANGAAKAEHDHRDLLAGVRFASGGLTLVAGGGRGRLDVDQRRNDAHADIDSWMVGGQVGYRAGGLRANAGVTWASHDVDTVRNVVFPGFADTLTANRDGSTRSIYGEVAYATDLPGLHLEPFVGASWQKVSLDAVTENGGDAALSIDRIHARSTVTEVGIRFGGTANASAGGLYPVGTLAWQHLFGDRHADMTAAFDGGDAFVIHGAERGRDGLRANLGLGYRIGAANVSVSYDGRIAERDVDHAVRLGVSVGF